MNNSVRVSDVCDSTPAGVLQGIRPGRLSALSTDLRPDLVVEAGNLSFVSVHKRDFEYMSTEILRNHNEPRTTDFLY